MQKITIKNSTFDLVANHAIGTMSTKGATFHPHNKTVTIEISDELQDILDDEIDELTPNYNELLVALCTGGKVNRSQSEPRSDMTSQPCSVCDGTGWDNSAEGQANRMRYPSLFCSGCYVIDNDHHGGFVRRYKPNSCGRGRVVLGVEK